MQYLYKYVCILNVFFIYVYGQLSAIKNLLFIIKVTIHGYGMATRHNLT